MCILIVVVIWLEMVNLVYRCDSIFDSIKPAINAG